MPYLLIVREPASLTALASTGTSNGGTMNRRSSPVFFGFTISSLPSRLSVAPPVSSTPAPSPEQSTPPRRLDESRLRLARYADSGSASAIPPPPPSSAPATTKTQRSAPSSL